MMALVHLFRALGDPSRLEMVKRLSRGASHTMSSLSKGLDISRQGARKHLQILVDSKIITLVPKGRDTHVALDMDTLDKGKNFIAKLELQWEKRLEALRDFVDGT